MISVVEDLEQRLVPRTEDIDQLVMIALQMYAPRIADRGRSLIRRWRANGCTDPDLDLAEGLLAVAGASSSVMRRLQALEDVSASQAAAEAVNRVFRGEIRAAAELAQAHGWFLDDPDLTEPLSLVLLSVAMDGEAERAEVILRAWKRRWPGMVPEKVVSALQCEARVAYFQKQYGRELTTLLDASALASRSGLNAATVFVQPALAGAYLHNGEMRQARKIMGSWPAPGDGDGSPLQALHDMVRIDAQLLQERYDEAWDTARRYLRFGASMQNVTLMAEGRFYCVLSAPAERFHEELQAYRRLAYRHQLRRHLERLKVLEVWVDGGASEVRSARVKVTIRGQSRTYPAIRLWLPDMEWVGSVLFVDRIHGCIHIGGGGPHTLTRRRVLQRMLDAILDSEDHTLPIEDLFARLWSEPFDPVAHEGRIHVNVHRLRRWFEEHGGGGSLIEVFDGWIGLSEDISVCVLEMDGAGTPELPATPLHERIVQCLPTQGTRSPAELQQLLGVSRSQINRNLRHLLSRGRIERHGAGRTTRYSAVGGESR